MVKNEGENCWDACGGSGACPDYCGEDGACCKDGFDDPAPCPSTMESLGYHSCTTSTTAMRGMASHPLRQAAWRAVFAGAVEASAGAEREAE